MQLYCCACCEWMQQVARHMKSTKRNTIDVSPSMKERIRKVAKKNGLGVTIVTEVILESAMSDFESGRSKVVATVAEKEEA